MHLANQHLHLWNAFFEFAENPSSNLPKSALIKTSQLLEPLNVISLK